MTFDEIMNWSNDNQDVFNDLSEQIKRGNIVPFVGAGMSAPLYPMWGQALDYLIGKFNSKVRRKDIKRIKNNKADPDSYTTAVDKIIGYRGEMNVSRDLLTLFNESKIKDDELMKMAVYLVPMLFPDSPVITTNYDRVLEHVYEMNGCRFDTVSDYSNYLAHSATRQNLHTLFKIHGDIGREAIDFSRIILSKQSYDDVYYENSELIKSLSNFYDKKIIFFLGCSLNFDRTVDLLRKIASSEDLFHYAIIECPKNKLDDKIGYLKDLGVRAIFYKSGDYDSVRIILEELLRKSNLDMHKLYARNYYTAPSAKENLLAYDSSSIEFYGRETELAGLQKFTEDSRPFLWWAVAGPNGSGKSRLLFEYLNSLRTHNWDISMIRDFSLECLDELVAGKRKCFIVFDDIDSYLSQCGKWLLKMLHTPMNNVIRVVFVIHGDDDNEAENRLNALFEDDTDLQLYDCFYLQKALYITPMDDQYLISVMKSVMRSRNKKVSEERLEIMLEVLKNADPEFKRPIYAMLIACANITKKNALEWDSTKILNLILEREQKKTFSTIRDFTGRKRLSQKEKALINEIIVIAYICKSIEINQFQADYSDLWHSLEEFCNNTSYGTDPEELLTYAGILHHGNISRNEPDIICEYYVSNQMDILEKYIQKGIYIENAYANEFMHRLIYNYYYSFLSRESLLETYLNSIPSDPGVLYEYLFTLTTIVGKGSEAIRQKALNLLKKNYTDNPGEMSAIQYAVGLYNFSTVNAARDTQLKVIEILRSLFLKYPYNGLIKQSFAWSVFNAASNKKIDNTRDLVDMMKDIVKKYDNDEELIILYGELLQNMIDTDDQSDLAMYKSDLDSYYKLYSNFGKVKTIYGAGLLNYLIRNPNCNEDETLKTIKKVYEETHDEDAAEVYSKAIAQILIRSKETDHLQDYLTIIQNLLDEYDENMIIVDSYARGLRAVIFLKDTGDIKKEMDMMDDLSNKYPQNRNVGVIYAQTLVTELNIYQFEESQDYLNRLEQLKKRLVSSVDLFKLYYEGFVNYSSMSFERACIAYDKMHTVWLTGGWNHTFALNYAKCICNLCSHWEENQIWKKSDIKAQMDELDHYFNDDEMIPRILADAMYYLF